MKKFSLIVLLCLLGLAVHARHGYKIKVTFKQDIPDSVIYLAHYYAKPPPTIYKIDSAVVVNKRNATFETGDSVLGGIYLVLFDKNSKFADVVINNGDDMEMAIDADNLPAGIIFKNSPENASYAAYQADAEKYGKKMQGLSTELKDAKTSKDTQRIRDQYKKAEDGMHDLQKKYVTEHPNTLLAEVFKAITPPEVPKGKHYLSDGKTVDSLYPFNYIHDHFWDNFNFHDNRIMYTPIYDGRLNDYFSNYVYPVPDSFNKAADELIARARPSSEIFKYTLHWLAGYTETSKIMGMDESFVYLVENYYMKGDASWLDSAQLAKYTDRAQKIAPNVIGNPAPALNLKDVFTLQDVNLNTIQAPYTLLVFWSPECAHCQHEIPLLDSLYNAKLKSYGVKVLSVPTDGELDSIRNFIKQYKITEWENAVEPNSSSYRSQYDVYSTPKIYLLDEKKTIQGKGLDHTNILNVIQYLEKKKKEKGTK